MKSSLNIKLSIQFLILFTNIQVLFGQNWEYPNQFIFSSMNDTSYSINDDVKVVERVRRNNLLYEYYYNGNLKSISEIKVNRKSVIYDVDGNIQNQIEYSLHGKCKIFYNDSNKTIAAIGEYCDNEIVGVWQFYDNKHRLIQKNYPFRFYRRQDYYNYNGKIERQIDILYGLDKKYIVKRAELQDNKLIANIDYPLPIIFILYSRKTTLIILLICLVLRLIINNKIVNIENGTNFSLLYFYYPFNKINSKRFQHIIEYTFAIWFLKYKPINRNNVIISNSISLIFFVFFLLNVITEIVISM